MEEKRGVQEEPNLSDTIEREVKYGSQIYPVTMSTNHSGETSHCIISCRLRCVVLKEPRQSMQTDAEMTKSKKKGDKLVTLLKA